MLRALLWKEWRQLRGLRGSGIALGAVLPAAFVAGAEAARRGVTLFGSARDYSTSVLFGEALWGTLAMGLWPLVALLTTAQAYAGDHAAGTETFLLERPVPRGRIWLARLVACVGSVSVVAAATTAIALALALMAGVSLHRGYGGLLAAGGAMSVLALLGGITAASFVRAPIAAVLLGGLLGAIPPVASGVLAAAFPYASILGGILPWLLIPAYVAASLRGLCAGEPLGGGRIRRMLLVVVPVAVACVLLFVTLAPAIVRLGARGGFHGVAPSAGGTAAFVGGGGWARRFDGGWLVDTRDASKRRFFPPSVSGAAFKADGSEVAVVTDSGRLGGTRDGFRVEFCDPTGKTTRPAIDLGEAFVWDLSWAGERILAKRRVARKEDVVVIEPDQGTVRSTGFSLEGFVFDAKVSVVDGTTAFIAVVPTAVAGAGASNVDGSRYPDGPIPILLHRIDVGAARVDPEPSIRDAGHPDLAEVKLSRDGRYWVLNQRDGAGFRRTIVEVATGRALDLPRVTALHRWMADDRIAWIEARGARKRLVIGRPGEPGRPLREWENAVVTLEPSPDGKLLLVRAARPKAPDPLLPSPAVTRREPEDDPTTFTTGELPLAGVPSIGVYSPESDAWIEPAAWSEPAWAQFVPAQREDVAGPSPWWARTTWAGPRTLARRTLETIAFEDLDRPGELRFVLGTAPPELRAAAR